MFLQMHPELGASTYDLHSDGSGVCYASGTAQSWTWRQGSPCGTRRGYADSRLARAERPGVRCPDRRGAGPGRFSPAGPYRCVISGSHPEYTSQSMSDALLTYLEQGGRFMYLGGNGFYWKIAYHPEDPGLIEPAGRGWRPELDRGAG